MKKLKSILTNAKLSLEEGRSVLRSDRQGSYVPKEKPNSKRWKNELERCYMPYTSECYDWDYLVTIFMNEYRMNKYDAVDLVAIIRQEVYG